MVAFNFTNDLPWFCLRTQNKHEHIAAGFLKTISGVEVFAPRIQYRKATSRGARVFVEALFPGYIFAQFDPAPLLTMIRSGHGVSGIVHFGGKYATVSPMIIEELRLHTGTTEIKQVESSFQIGDEVTINEGAFKSCRALVSSLIPAKDRIRILFEFLGRPMEVEVPTGEVTARFIHPLSEEGDSSRIEGLTIHSE